MTTSENLTGTQEHEIDIATVCEDDMIEMCKHFANWSKERIISEAVQWLEKNADAHTWYNEFKGESRMADDFINKFKEALQKMKINELTKEVTLTREEYNELTKKKETPGNMLPYIVWNGDNIQEVLNFTGVDSRFDEWFKSFEDYENYVHSHGDIFKIFINNSMTHYECPVGTIIVKTEAGYNYPLGIVPTIQ